MLAQSQSSSLTPPPAKTASSAAAAPQGSREPSKSGTAVAVQAPSPLNSLLPEPRYAASASSSILDNSSSGRSAAPEGLAHSATGSSSSSSSGQAPTAPAPPVGSSRSPLQSSGQWTNSGAAPDIVGSAEPAIAAAPPQTSSFAQSGSSAVPLRRSMVGSLRGRAAPQKQDILTVGSDSDEDQPPRPASSQPPAASDGLLTEGFKKVRLTPRMLLATSQNYVNCCCA